MTYKIVTAADNENLREIAGSITTAAWPEFMLHDPLSNTWWGSLYLEFPDFQFILVHPKTEHPVAAGHCIPLAWGDEPGNLPDSGWDWALVKGFEDRKAGRRPTVCCALAVAIPTGQRNRGLSKQAVIAMKSIAAARGFATLLAPVRPSLKSHYPLIPMDTYVHWQNEDGRPFDPWIRVHAGLGAKIVKVCPQSMRITGTIDEWERWTPLRYPGSGQYIVPGGLVPVHIDREADQGVYIEPNVWMIHRLEPQT